MTNNFEGSLTLALPEDSHGLPASLDFMKED